MSVSTTADPPSTTDLLIQAQRTADGWLVSDLVTTRFGYGATLVDAVADWQDDLMSLLDVDGPLAPPLGKEVAWARKVLGA